MRSTYSLFFLVLLVFSKGICQTTSFKDSYWYDMKKYGSGFYSHPISEPSEMTLSKDQIEVALGDKKVTYVIKEVKELPKRSMTQYTVVREGKEGVITIGKGGETLDGKPRAMITDGAEWVMLPMLININPPGWWFPGEPKIDIEAERARIVGYYEFMTLGFTNKVDLNKDGFASDSYADEMNECQKDLQLELLADNTGTWWQGQRVKDCKKAESTFRWKLEEVVIRGKKVLTLFLIDGVDSREFKVKEITNARIVIIGGFNFGTEDTTIDATLELAKRKRKK